MTRRAFHCWLAAFVVWALAVGGSRAETASFDDTARFLAGMQPRAGSPLAPLTKERGWQQYANALDKAFAEVEKKQLAPIRDWVKEKLPSPRPNLFYIFSGPDFLYANAFFPGASTYVLAGLEPIGQVPDLMKMQHHNVVPGLDQLQHSMRTLLAVSFFITKDMSVDLNASQLRGTLPIIYVFLVRAGKQITGVDMVILDESGGVRPETGRINKPAARGVRIAFKSDDGREQTLYYFSTDVSNDGVKKSGFLRFADSLGVGDGFIKSASYLMHREEFSRVRDFLVNRSAVVLEDDSGIPLRYFDSKKWEFSAFGNYYPPFDIFPGTYQPAMRNLFKGKAPGKLNFGVGYRWRPGESHLILAVRESTAGVRQNAAEAK